MLKIFRFNLKSHTFQCEIQYCKNINGSVNTYTFEGTETFETILLHFKIIYIYKHLLHSSKNVQMHQTF